MRNHLPFYFGLVAALLFLLLSASPPAVARSQSVLIAQREFKTIEASIKGMQSEITDGYDSSTEREKYLPQSMARMDQALTKLRTQYDQEDPKANLQSSLVLAAACSALVGLVISQAMVIRSLKQASPL